MNGRLLKNFVSILTSLVFCTYSMALMADGDDTGRDDKQVYHLYNNVDLISTIKIQYDKPRIVIKSVFPRLALHEDDNGSNENATNLDNINTNISVLVDQAILDFKQYVHDNVSAQQALKKLKIRNDFYLDYNASFIKPNRTPIISIRFSTQGVVTGMAHPYHRYFVFNYDLESEENMTLDDLFEPDSDYLTVLSNYASSKLNRKLEDKQLITKGTAPVAENFKLWNLKSNGLLVTFDEGQVAPSYLGAQTILIPFSALKEIIASDSPLHKCVEKKRCGTDILTGGFIDEANNSRAINTRHRRLNPILSQR